MKSLWVFVLCIFLTGCTTYTPEQVRSFNDTNLSSGGELIGTLNGKELRRYRIFNPNMHDHYVYVVGDAVTVNRTIQHGKTTSNTVEVYINGVKQ